jgi:SAM-dependent methyltransferase
MLMLLNKNDCYPETNPERNEMQNTDKSKVKSQGAVFTPRPLIREILDCIPRRMWETQRKWLEPSAGVGHFVTEILDKYTQSKPSITAIEIDPVYAQQCSNKCPSASIMIGDFLTIAQTLEKGDKYDVIIGNPPYQRPNKKTGKARGGRGQLYMDFLKQCLRLLAPGGYLAFVHPPNWRKPGSPVLHFILNRMTIRTLNTYMTKVFTEVTVPVDWYVFENNPPTPPTLVNGTLLPLSKDLPFIPNNLTTKLHDRVLDLTRNWREGIQFYKCIISCDLHAHTKKHLLSKVPSNVHIYKIFNTSANPTLWSIRPHKYQTTRKVVMSTSGNLYPFYDEDIGTTQNARFIPVTNKEEGDRIIDFLKSLEDVLPHCQWGMYRTERLLIEMLVNYLAPLN